MADSPRGRWRGQLTTVRVRLTVLAVLIVGIGLAAGGTVVLVLVRHNLMANAANEAQQRARATAALFAVGRLPPMLPAAGEDRAVVQVVDRDGHVVAASAELRDRGPLLSRWPENGMLTVTLRRPPIGDGADYTVAGLVAEHAGQPVAVYAASSLEPVSEGVEATAFALAVAFPVLLVVVGGTSWLLIGRALRPVEAIRSQVAEITASELDRRVPEPRIQDELGRLARTMNAMLARLQQAHDRQRRFVSDASHELRSPLATILTQVEVGLAHPADTDWVRLAQDVHREGGRLDRLVDELLALSRADGDAAQDKIEPVDLDELVLLEIDAVRARGKVSVDLSPFSAVRLRGRPDQLRRLVRNLLDNAERHAERVVTVGLSSDARVAELVVADDGEGIPVAERERVFDRFFRLQPARDRDSGGAGLGLAIVRDVAAAYGGQVWVADARQGAELHVRLPLGTAELGTAKPLGTADPAGGAERL
jgi:signal transduction histidine kinase